jgi:hypothetical protein
MTYAELTEQFLADIGWNTYRCETDRWVLAREWCLDQDIMSELTADCVAACADDMVDA